MSDTKTVLITGGSGALGKALVKHFSALDYHVIFTYFHNKESADILIRETGASGLQVDLTNGADVKRVTEAILAEFGSVDILINNAGRTQVMPFALLEEEDWDDIMAANLKSMFLITKEIVRGMIHKKQGNIINVGSLAGHRLLDVPVHYATAKAGVMGFTLSLAKELARYNIRVNSVVPGLLEEGVGQMVPEKELKEYISYCTAARPGKTSEVAEVIGFLASDKASYMNAQNIFVDGGI